MFWHVDRYKISIIFQTLWVQKTNLFFSQEQFTREKGFKMATEQAIKGESLPNPPYNCHIHEKSLMPMLCRDCQSSVCMDCLVTTHVGHKLSKISDNIENKFSILNYAIQKEESTCFNLSKLHENIRKRLHHVRTQKEQVIQRVTNREEEIISLSRNYRKNNRYFYRNWKATYKRWDIFAECEESWFIHEGYWRRND